MAESEYVPCRIARKPKRPPRPGRRRSPRRSIDAKRAKAYGEMENSVCDLSRAATLAMEVFDKDELFLFAVGQLDFMVQRFKDRYYAEEFPGEN